MIQDLPVHVSIFFGLIVIVTIIWQYMMTKSKSYLILLCIWTALQAGLGYSGIFQDTATVPPKILAFGVMPTIVMMLIAFLTSQGRTFMDRFDLKSLTYFHVIRVPVEIVLALLFHYGFVSRLMTFEGTNFDIFSGISAPLVAFLVFKTVPIRKTLLTVWNVVCLLLLLNVVITAVFAIPSPFQKIAFDQPNIAILYFPFNLLPSVVVPVVLFGHLVAFRQLLRKEAVSN